MGKTEKGAVWLNKEFVSPYSYWQFWRNTDDKDVKRFLKFFTEIEENEIEMLCKSEGNINKLKIILANEATKILHGAKASKTAEITAKETFEGKGIGLDLPEIKIKMIQLNEEREFNQSRASGLSARLARSSETRSTARW